MKTPVGSEEARTSRNGARSEAIDTALVTVGAVAVTSDDPTPAMYRPATTTMADNFRFSDLTKILPAAIN